MPTSPQHAAADAPVTEPIAPSSHTSADRKIRVILVDDHRIVREGLRALLQLVSDIEVVGEADSGPAAVALAAECIPDVVVMDLSMPGGGGAEATRQLAASVHPPAVLVLTMHDEAEYLVPLLECGARGFLTKDAAELELEDAIRAVAAGEVFVRPSVARLLAAQVGNVTGRSSDDDLRAQYERLSARERDVLHLVAEGYNGPEIGQRLGITAKTVDTYKYRIDEKIGLRHRAAYIKFVSAFSALSPGPDVRHR